MGCSVRARAGEGIEILTSRTVGNGALCVEWVVGVKADKRSVILDVGIRLGLV
jgi:hypothetical protein